MECVSYFIIYCILFSVVFTPPPPISRHGSVWRLPVISQILKVDGIEKRGGSGRRQ